MKKVFTVLCVMMMAVSCVFCGCGKKEENNNNTTTTGSEATVNRADSPYLGTWKVVRAKFKDEEVPVEEVFEEDFIVVMNEDGTGTVTGDNGDEPCNWVETSDGVKLTGDNANLSFKYENGELVFELFGFQLFLAKQ